MTQGVIQPRRERTFFVGWEASSPAVDRRFLLASALGLVAAGGGAAYALASNQRGPGAGTWDQGEVRTLSGVFRRDPYPRLITADLDGAMRSVYLVCPVKCAPAAEQLEVGRSNDAIAATGTLLQRGRYAMMAVNAGADGIVAADLAEPAAAAPRVREVGRARFEGEILDAKCWFGAMRPGQGKPHKACATLCVRHGIPPAFLVRDAALRDHALMVTDRDGAAPIGPILPYIADPVAIEGTVVAVDDTLRFQIDPSAITRI